MQGTLFDEQTKDGFFVLHPLSKVRMLWDCLITLFCIYIALVVPFAVVFEDALSKKVGRDLQTLDRCINYFFMFDVVLNFRTGYFNRDFELVMNGKKVARNYLLTWFLLDLVSSLPFDDFNAAPNINLQVAKVLKMFKLVRVVKLLKPRNVDFEGVSDILDDIQQSKLTQMVYRRSTVLINMLLLCHWMACGMKLVDEGFLEGYDRIQSGDLWAEYLAALYWSMTTITTVGYGDICPTTDKERAYTISAMVVGGAFYGYVVGSITSMVSNNDLNASAYYDRMDLIYAWLTHHRFPPTLRRGIVHFFKGYLTEKSAVDEATIWQDLSPELQKNVGEYMIHEDVKSNPLFDGMGIHSVVQLQSVLRRFTVKPGHTIAEKGEVGSAMYIVVSGWLQMDTGDEEVDEDGVLGSQSTNWHTLATEGKINLGPGQSFGEEVLLGLVETYEYTVTVLEKTKLEMIFENEFNSIFQCMPNELERMRQNALELHPQLAQMHAPYRGDLSTADGDLSTCGLEQ